MASSSSKIVKEGDQVTTVKEAKRWYEEEGSPEAQQILRYLAVLLAAEAEQEAGQYIDEIVHSANNDRIENEHADMEQIIYGAVFFVTIRGSVEALKKLASIKDLDWSTVNKRGLTALHRTMRDKDFGRGLEKAKFLQGLTDIDITALDDYGRSVLHCAACTSDKNALEFCLQLGLDINGKDGAGRTPLHCATMSFNEGDIIRGNVEFLIERGADPDVKDETGSTPLDTLMSNMNGSAELKKNIKQIIQRKNRN